MSSFAVSASVDSVKFLVSKNGVEYVSFTGTYKSFDKRADVKVLIFDQAPILKIKEFVDNATAEGKKNIFCCLVGNADIETDLITIKVSDVTPVEGSKVNFARRFCRFIRIDRESEKGLNGTLVYKTKVKDDEKSYFVKFYASKESPVYNSIKSMTAGEAFHVLSSTITLNPYYSNKESRDVAGVGLNLKEIEKVIWDNEKQG